MDSLFGQLRLIGLDCTVNTTQHIVQIIIELLPDSSLSLMYIPTFVIIASTVRIEERECIVGGNSVWRLWLTYDHIKGKHVFRLLNSHLDDW